MARSMPAEFVEGVPGRYGRSVSPFGASQLRIALSPANVVRLFNPRSNLLAKIVLAIGVSYLFLPIDLIPDRLGWVGHIDEAAFLLLGLAGGLLLAVPSERPGGSLLRKWTRRLAGQTARLTIASTAGSAVGRIVLRMILGRWPDHIELAAFRTGLDANSHSLPPLLRAAAYVPAAAPLLNRSMLLSAQRGGTGTSRKGAKPLGPAQMMGDPMTIWRGPKVRFLHLEKTAGSSLINALTAQFHPLQIDPDPERNHPPHLRRPFPATTFAAQHDASLVWGHYDLPSLHRLAGGRPDFTLCMFRDPRRRLLSLYYYWRANQEDQAPTVRWARENGLLAFLRAEDPLIVNYIDNLYVRRLTGIYATRFGDHLSTAPQQALDTALGCLEGLGFVGLSDRMEESLSQLGTMIGFEPPAHTPQVNVLARSEQNVFLPYRPTLREPITPEIDAELERLTRLDQVIYRQVGERFQNPGRPRENFGGTVAIRPKLQWTVAS